MVTAPDAPSQSYPSVAAPDIPFRGSAGPSPQDFAGVLLMAVTLLVLTATLLRFAKRKGWAAPWLASKPRVQSRGEHLRVDTMVRLSRSTVLYRVRHAAHHYLVVESDRNVKMVRVEVESEELDHVED